MQQEKISEVHLGGMSSLVQESGMKLSLLWIVPLPRMPVTSEGLGLDPGN